MYISKKELFKLVKDNNIRGCSEYSKAQLIDTLKAKGIISDEINENEKDPERYKHVQLQGARKASKTVIIIII